MLNQRYPQQHKSNKKLKKITASVTEVNLDLIIGTTKPEIKPKTPEVKKKTFVDLEIEDLE